MEINKDLKIENTNTKLEDLSCSVLPSGTDLNNCKTTGIFYCDGENTYTNLPEGVNGWLVVLKSPNVDTYCKQLWFRHGTANTNGFHSFTRELHGSTWSNWDRYVVSSETDVFLPISGGTLTGKVILSNQGYEDGDDAGYLHDRYGNMKHKRTNASDNWHIDNYNGDAVFRFYPETGEAKMQGVSLWDMFSTSETKTNKVWIDNKPIYRKVYSAKITTSGNKNVSSFFPSNLETLVNFYGTAKSSSYSYPFYYKDDTDNFICLKTNRTLTIQIGSTFPEVPFDCDVVVEYTKSS